MVPVVPPPAHSPAASAWPPVLRALRHRNYRLYFCGQLFSLTGTWMQNIAQAWLLYRLTDSGALLGLLSFVQQIPVFLMISVGGVLSDRVNRHRLVIATQYLSAGLAGLLALLVLTDRIEVWHLFLLGGLLGVVNSIDIPARQSLVADIVERADLPNAIGLYSSAFNGARVLGPALAGVLVALIGEGWCFLINALSFIPVLIGLHLMRVATAPRPATSSSPGAQLLEGFAYVRSHRPIRAVLMLLAVFCMAGTPYLVLLPLLADRVFGGGADSLGLLMGASGLGAMLGAILLAARQSAHGLPRWIARAVAAFGLSLLLLSQSQTLWLAALILVGTGAGLVLTLSASNALVQTLLPDALRGRVMSIFYMTVMGAGPIGSLAAGALAEWVGAAMTVAGGGIACLLASLSFHRQLPALAAAQLAVDKP